MAGPVPRYGTNWSFVLVAAWNTRPATWGCCLPGVADRHLAGILLEPGDQSLQVVRRHGFFRGDDERRDDQERNRLEIFRRS